METRETNFFEGWSCFKFNNLRLALGMALKFYTIVTKGLKVKVGKFWGLIVTFAEFTREKLVGGLFITPTPLVILNWVQIFCRRRSIYQDTLKWLRKRFLCVALLIRDILLLY